MPAAGPYQPDPFADRDHHERDHDDDGDPGDGQHVDDAADAFHGAHNTPYRCARVCPQRSGRITFLRILA